MNTFFLKSTSHFQILGIRKVKRNKKHIPQWGPIIMDWLWTSPYLHNYTENIRCHHIKFVTWDLCTPAFSPYWLHYTSSTNHLLLCTNICTKVLSQWTTNTYLPHQIICTVTTKTYTKPYPTKAKSNSRPPNPCIFPGISLLSNINYDPGKIVLTE
jgi:hypothetical protein